MKHCTRKQARSEGHFRITVRPTALSLWHPRGENRVEGMGVHAEDTAKITSHESREALSLHA